MPPLKAHTSASVEWAISGIASGLEEPQHRHQRNPQRTQLAVELQLPPGQGEVGAVFRFAVLCVNIAHDKHNRIRIPARSHRTRNVVSIRRKHAAPAVVHNIEILLRADGLDALVVGGKAHRG